MARARTKAQREPAPTASHATLRRAESAAPEGAPAASLARAAGLGPQQAARLRVAGNAAVRRTVARNAAPGAAPLAALVAPSSAPAGPQRLWDRKEFGARTYESFFTAKSHAQKAVEQLIVAYFALEPSPKGMPTAAHANLLAQMKTAAEFWINDHTATDEQGTVEDPARKNRMRGFKDFVANVDAELGLVKTVLGDQFSAEIGEQHQAFTTLQDRYTGSASSLFTKAAGLVDRVVSSPGDSARVEIEFAIPVDPSGVGFIGGRLSIDASREDNQMVKARTEMAVTGGANVGVAKLKAELGGYIEAQAPTAAEVMNLYSYGMYRRFRESDVIPSGMTNYLWGGSRGDYGKKKAENWSRELEQQLFTLLPLPDQNDPEYQSISNPAKRKEKYETDLAAAEAAQQKVRDIYVSTGGIVAGKGEVGLSDVIGLAVGVKYTSGKKITADSIAATKGAAGARNEDPWLWGGQKALGADVSAISGSISLEFPGGGGSLTITGSGEQRSITFEVGGKVPASALDGLASYLTKVAVDGVKLYRTLQAADSKTEALGPMIALATFNTTLVGTPVYGAITGEGLKAAGNVGLKFIASMQRNEGQWSGALELKHVSELGTDVGGAFKAKLEKQARLGKWTYSSSGWA